MRGQRMGRLAAGALVVSVLGAGGCVIVVDHDYECHLSEEGPRHVLGISLDNVSPAMASQLGVDREKAALVTWVGQGSAAEAAGIRRYDVVTRVDGEESASPGRVREAIRTKKRGEELKMTVLREGKPVEVTATMR